MRSLEDLSAAMQSARQRLREAEIALLAERQLNAELSIAYREAQTVRPEALPPFMRNGG